MRLLRAIRLACIRLACIALACVLGFDASIARADDAAPPERLLAAGSIAYWRFDGWGPHQAAMDRTAFGQVMHGDLGKLFDSVEQIAVKQFLDSTLSGSLLAGKRPGELKKVQAAAKQIPMLLPAFVQHGVAVGIESAGNRASPSITIVLPQGKSLYAVARLLAGQIADESVTERKIKDRLVLIAQSQTAADSSDQASSTPQANASNGEANAPAAAKPNAAANAAAKTPAAAAQPAAQPPAQPPAEQPPLLLSWAEGDDLLIVSSAEPAERIVDRVLQRREKNLLDNPLYQQAARFKSYETLSRGFINVQPALVEIGTLADFDKLPKLAAALGFGNVRQLIWHTGVEGRHQRYTIELGVPGERHGLLRLIGGTDDIGGILPAMPPDLNQFHVFDLRLEGSFDEFRKTALAVAAVYGDDQAKIAHAADDASRAALTLLGIDVQRDLLDSLGPRVVAYSSPSEGPLFLGGAVAIQVVHPDKLSKALATFATAGSVAASGQFRIDHLDYHGADLATMRFGSDTPKPDASVITPFTPSYTICDGWLVIAPNPQTIKGFILRQKNPSAEFPRRIVRNTAGPGYERGYESWQPSPLITEVVEKEQIRSPKVRIMSIHESDPRPAIKFALSVAPLIGSVISNALSAKFDNRLIPNAQEVVEPLYPNVSIVVDEGETIRIDGYKSAPFPFDSTFMILSFRGLTIFGGIF